MDQRRLLIFLALSAGLMLGWNYLVVGPKIEQQELEAERQRAVAARKKQAEQPVEPADPQAKPPQPEPPEAEAPKPLPTALVPADFESVTLGSRDPGSGYALAINLVSAGAAIESIEINDRRRYPPLREPGHLQPPDNQLLKLVGNHLVAVAGKDGRLDATELGAQDREQPPGTARVPLTLATAVDVVDRQLEAIDPNADLNHVNWSVKLIPDEEPQPNGGMINRGVEFRYLAPDGSVELVKRYQLKRISENDDLDTDPAAYTFTLELELNNLTEQPLTLSYRLTGPVGLPLENKENTRKYIDIKAAYFEPDELAKRQPVALGAISASEIAKAGAEQEPRSHTFHHVGLDIQYFAVLVFLPAKEQFVVPARPVGFLKEIRPLLIAEAIDEPSHSDISVELVSHPITLQPASTIRHTYTLFAGPKRNRLLDKLPNPDDDTSPGAPGVMDITTFAGIGHVARLMMKILNAIHGVIPNYGVAILLLTVLVRGALSPISRKQAKQAKLSSEKMQEMKPELDALKKKYGDDKQGLMTAQQQLYRKHNFNPLAQLAGCLPMLLQLPIFFGLYQSLSTSVDLRMAPVHPVDPQPRGTRRAVGPRLRRAVPGQGVQPAAAGDRGAVPGEQQDVHAAADFARGRDAAEDDELHDDLLRLPVLPHGFRPAAVLHRLDAVGHGRTKAARLPEEA